MKKTEYKSLEKNPELGWPLSLLCLFSNLLKYLKSDMRVILRKAAKFMIPRNRTAKNLCIVTYTDTVVYERGPYIPIWKSIKNAEIMNRSQDNAAYMFRYAVTWNKLYIKSYKVKRRSFVKMCKCVYIKIQITW